MQPLPLLSFLDTRMGCWTFRRSPKDRAHRQAASPEGKPSLPLQEPSGVGRFD